MITLHSLHLPNKKFCLRWTGIVTKIKTFTYRICRNSSPHRNSGPPKRLFFKGGGGLHENVMGFGFRKGLKIKWSRATNSANTVDRNGMYLYLLNRCIFVPRQICLRSSAKKPAKDHCSCPLNVQTVFLTDEITIKDDNIHFKSEKKNQVTRRDWTCYLLTVIQSYLPWPIECSLINQDKFVTLRTMEVFCFNELGVEE